MEKTRSYIWPSASKFLVPLPLPHSPLLLRARGPINDLEAKMDLVFQVEAHFGDHANAFSWPPVRKQCLYFASSNLNASLAPSGLLNMGPLKNGSLTFSRHFCKKKIQYQSFN